MKLRNKKTGEIVEAHEIDLIDDYVYLKIFRAGDYDTKQYNSLAELNEEWEDYEEPKEYWYIDIDGEITYGVTGNVIDQDMQRIGNYFETKEEAEKAVRKLKAWKRLKDNYHISFNLDFAKNTISFTYQINDTLHSVVNEEHIVFEDMKTIFGGEELTEISNKLKVKNG